MKLFNEFNAMMAASYGADWDRYLSGEQATTLRNAFYAGAMVAVGEISAGAATSDDLLLSQLVTLNEELNSYLNELKLEVSKQR